MYRLLKAAILIALILLSTLCAAVTRTAVSSGSFSTAARWSPNGAPGAGDSLIIPAGITITSNQNGQACYALVVYGTFNAPKNNFAVTNLYNYGTITSDGNNFQSAGKIINTGLIDINGNNFAVNNLINSGTMTFDGGSPTITGTVVNTGTITGVNLPIDLLYFTASTDAKTNVLSWATATEYNNDYFTIDKSIDGVLFDRVTIIRGAGTSNRINRYVYKEAADIGTVYYRLSQTDFDGTTKSFNIVSVMQEKIEKNNYTIHIYDMNGNLVKSCSFSELSDVNTQNGLTRGVYIMELITSSRTYTRKFAIE